MTSTRKGFLFVVALRQIILPIAAIFALRAQAQFTGNNQTNIISGVTNNWPGNYYVGSNYVFDALLIQNSGVLSNAAAYIGYNVGANSNTAIVSGIGSTWENIVHVGESGTGNRLVVSAGGTLFGGGFVGYNIGASNNSVLVADSGSVWHGGMFVGRLGAGNSLVISNTGGVVANLWSSVGGDGGVSSVSASNNSALVTGSGSLWSNGAALFVGDNASGNRLVISAGASVVGSDSWVGFNGTGSPPFPRDNSALVTGSGSMWSNSGSLVVGAYSSVNSLVISNGARVFDRDGKLVGGSGNGGSVSNRVIVTDPGSIWNNSSAFSVGGSDAGTMLVVSNGAAVSAFSGYIAGKSGMAVVTGGNSVWSNSSTLSIDGESNSVVIADGGLLVGGSYSAYLGYTESSKNNSVRVTGSGSVWSNYNLYVGYTGVDNSLIVTNGARVISSYGFLGYGSTLNYGHVTNNSVLVTGSGSVWSNRFDLCVGYSGASPLNYATIGNSLVISNGGSVFDEHGYVGASVSQSTGSNSVLVTGNGSFWWNNRQLFVGGVGSSLVVSNGGRVSAASALLYYGSGADRITVADGSLYVTNAGIGLLKTLDGVLSLNGGKITADNILAYGVFAFDSGVLNSAGTAVTNTQQFVGGDGTNSAIFHLMGGDHSFNNGLRIRTNSFLTGCGTINGSVLVEAGGAVLAEGCGILIFTGNVTNNGVMIADNGSVLESSGTLVNNGTILLLDDSTANFHRTFINNGVISKPDINLAIERDGSGGLFIRFTGAPAVTYRLQRAASLTGTWSDLATNTAPASGLIEYHEISPPPGQAFYRAVQP